MTRDELIAENRRLRGLLDTGWRKRRVTTTAAGQQVLTLRLTTLLRGTRKRTVYVRDTVDGVQVALHPEDS